jgi:hypothetical protein
MRERPATSSTKIFGSTRHRPKVSNGLEMLKRPKIDIPHEPKPAKPTRNQIGA